MCNVKVESRNVGRESRWTNVVCESRCHGEHAPRKSLNKKTPYQLILLVGGLPISPLALGQLLDLMDMDVLGWEGGHVLGLQLGLARPLSCVFVLHDRLGLVLVAEVVLT